MPRASPASPDLDQRRPLSHLYLSDEPADNFSNTNSNRNKNLQQLDLQSSGGATMQVAVTDQDQRTTAIDNIFYTNAAIVSFIALSAIYQLTHTHVEALVALWEYDLGPHPADMTKLTVAVDTLTRLPLDLIHAYESLIPNNPIFYKACTSGVAYGLGDFISQIYQGKTLRTLDLPRSFRSGAAGFMVHGPLCHYWLTFMETYLDFGGAWWATGIKVTADLTVWSIFLNAAYSTVIGTLAGQNPADTLRDVRATQWPALRSAWRFWPFVHTISFSHAVSMDLKLLWVDVMEVIWVTILSKVANEDKIANLKEAEKVEGGDVEVLAALAVEEQVPENVDPSLEIELTRQVELETVVKGGAEPSFELPKKVLGACWPLLAMWPVLYAGYQVEVALGILPAP
jgi:protein Mpv17